LAIVVPYDLEDRLIRRTVGDSPAAEGQKPFDIQGVAKTSRRLATLFIFTGALKSGFTCPLAVHVYTSKTMMSKYR